MHMTFRFRERLWLSFKAILYFSPRRIIYSILHRCLAPSACEILAYYIHFLRKYASLFLTEIRKIFSGGENMFSRIHYLVAINFWMGLPKL